ncbi:MAG TPA: DUF2378 family protein [Polyangiales bacterium]
MKIKGSQLLGVVKALRAQGSRARELTPARLQGYFEARILAPTWYPEADFRDLLLVLGRLSPNVKGNVWRRIGNMGAERDFKGIYAAMIRPGDPEGTVKLFPVGWRQYRDTSELMYEGLGAGAAQLSLREYPINCRELTEVNAGYFETALRLAGAAEPQVTVTMWDEGSAHWHLRWR